MTGRTTPVLYVDIPDSFTDDAGILDNRQLEEKYQKSESTITRWRRRVQVPSPMRSTPKTANRYAFPDPDAKDYVHGAGILKIVGNTVVTSDWHAPYHDMSLCENMVRIAEKRKIRQLAIVGDLFDGATMSIFDPIDIAFDVREELQTTQATLVHLLKFFDRIYWSLGNHEMRLFRSLKFQLDLVDLAGFLVKNDKLVTTEYPWMQLESGGETFRLTHPKSYSVIPMRVASLLARKFGMHVMSAHGHLMGITSDVSGQYRCIDLGGMFDPDKIAYKHVGGDTVHPVAQSGFWIVEDGCTTPYSDTLTNWTSALGAKK